jgi:hypothetical protein
MVESKSKEEKISRIKEMKIKQQCLCFVKLIFENIILLASGSDHVKDIFKFWFYTCERSHVSIAPKIVF